MNDRLEKSNKRSWVYEVDGFHLDAVQKAKSEIAEDEPDVEYDSLRGRVINRRYQQSIVVVVKIR